nr:hypothetical protein Iba_chr01aCG16160 [Ipomoea batatas]
MGLQFLKLMQNLKMFQVKWFWMKLLSLRFELQLIPRIFLVILKKVMGQMRDPNSMLVVLWKK